MRFNEAVSNIKGATEACFKLGGGLTSFSLLVGLAVSTLSKYASLNEEHADRVIPLDIAIEADRRAKSPIIITEAARQLGYRLEPDAGGGTARQALSEDDVLAIMDEATDLWRMARNAYADGKLDALEKRDIGQKLRRLMRAAECVLQRLEDA